MQSPLAAGNALQHCQSHVIMHIAYKPNLTTFKPQACKCSNMCSTPYVAHCCAIHSRVHLSQTAFICNKYAGALSTLRHNAHIIHAKTHHPLAMHVQFLCTIHEMLHTAANHSCVHERHSNLYANDSGTTCSASCAWGVKTCSMPDVKGCLR